MADLDTSIDKRTPFKPPVKAAEVVGSAADPIVKIKIPKTKEHTRDVYVGVAGKAYLLQRGVEIPVPKSVAHALELAVQTEYEELVDPITGRATLIPQETMSVPFQYV